MERRAEDGGGEPQANGGETASFAERWAGKFEPSARLDDPRCERLARKYGLRVGQATRLRRCSISADEKRSLKRFSRVARPRALR